MATYWTLACRYRNSPWSIRYWEKKNSPKVVFLSLCNSCIQAEKLLNYHQIMVFHNHPLKYPSGASVSAPTPLCVCVSLPAHPNQHLSVSCFLPLFKHLSSLQSLPALSILYASDVIDVPRRRSVCGVMEGVFPRPASFRGGAKNGDVWSLGPRLHHITASGSGSDFAVRFDNYINPSNSVKNVGFWLRVSSEFGSFW